VVVRAKIPWKFAPPERQYKESIFDTRVCLMSHGGSWKLERNKPMKL
jgi:hypothetical protein